MKITNIRRQIVLMIMMMPGLVASAVAADRKGNFAIWGAGAVSCNQYNEARLTNNDTSFKGYISGYFTHYNTVTPETVNIAGSMNMLEILGLLDEICTENRIVSFNEALESLIEQLLPQRKRHSRHPG